MANMTVNMFVGMPMRPVDEAAVEVDVRVELAVDEVGILQGRLFQVAGDVQQRSWRFSLGSTLSQAALMTLARGS